MKAFLKDNIALVAAIALPAFLAVIFALSTVFTAVSVENPKNDFLIVTDYYEGSTRFQFDVNNDRLAILYRAADKDEHGNTINYTGKPRLWRVHVPEMSVQEIPLNRPEGNAAKNIAIAGITDVKVVNLSPGPDGYEFVDSYGYGGNIMTEIFSMDHHRERSAGIAKNGRLVSFTIPDNNSYYNRQFLGWIIEEGKGQ